MFKKPETSEPPEITALREALLSPKDTKITIEDGTGKTWTLYRDVMRGCQLVVGRSSVEQKGDDVVVRFVVYAENGRVG